MNNSVVETWSSEGIGRLNAYDQWVDKLMAAQGSGWTPGVTPAGGFRAALRHKVIDKINIIESRCDPCHGSRSERQVSLTEEHSIILLSYLEGREDIEFGGERYSLTAGDTFFWDSTQPTYFQVVEPLHKVALAIPASVLDPNLVGAIKAMPRKFNALSGSRFLLNSLISTMAAPEFDSAEVEGGMILEAVGALIGGAIKSSTPAGGSMRPRQKLDIRRYICSHIRDPNLSVSSIAAAKRISKRYLHWLFNDEPFTVNEFIISTRLEGCHADLQNPAYEALSVSQIAYSWGFANLSHFSKRYSARYGNPPSITRQAGYACVK